VERGVRQSIDRHGAAIVGLARRRHKRILRRRALCCQSAAQTRRRAMMKSLRVKPRPMAMSTAERIW
jgi:hypothetical protein